jgi:energy-coupling factor transport system ATP-binding protein
MEDGGVRLYDTPQAVCTRLKEIDARHPMNAALPAAARIFAGLNVDAPCPLTVREGQNFLASHFTNAAADHVEIPPRDVSGTETFAVRDLWFRYARNLPDVLRGVSFSVRRGERYFILGGNGVGKTTLLLAAIGLRQVYAGKIRVFGRDVAARKGGGAYKHGVALLPQDPLTLFVKQTVRADFAEICAAAGLSETKTAARIAESAALTDIAHLLESHPYDLSGGERQRCALALRLLTHPQILLLDEPTKGMDAFAKEALAAVLKELSAQGTTMITVTHDVDFACAAADRCALFFDGEILSEDEPHAFFAQNMFYTPAANRVACRLYKNAITAQEIIALCKANGGADEADV